MPLQQPEKVAELDQLSLAWRSVAAKPGLAYGQEQFVAEEQHLDAVEEWRPGAIVAAGPAVPVAVVDGGLAV